MKKINLLILGILFSSLTVCDATTREIQLSNFLYWQSQNKTISIPGKDYSCKDAKKLNNLFVFLSKNSFFLYSYYPNLWEGDNFQILEKYAEENESNNMLTKAIFPYVNDKLINNGDSISLYCKDTDFIYQAGAFDVTGTIIIENRIGKYENPTDSGKQEYEMKYKEISISLDNISDEKVKNLPFIKGDKMFIGCEDDSKNRLFWNGRTNDHYYNESKRYIDSYSGKPLHPEEELSQYKGKTISVRFYIFPSYIKKEYTPQIECENIWMLDYKVK